MKKRILGLALCAMVAFVGTGAIAASPISISSASSVNAEPTMMAYIKGSTTTTTTTTTTETTTTTTETTTTTTSGLAA
jgi:hypothetical protein